MILKKFYFIIAVILYSSLEVSAQVWTQKANFGGTARYVGSGFAIGTKGYIGTGIDGASQNDFWEWDQATDAWTQKANFAGTSRFYIATFVIGTKGYFCTGENPRTKELWEYDQTGNTWTQKADFAGVKRYGAFAFSIGTKGYVGAGGDDPNFYKDFWEWDQATDSWTQKADFGGTARFYAVGFSIGNKGYVGTGSDGSNQKDFWEYAPPPANTWTPKADFGGTARRLASGFSICDKGYIGIGWSNTYEKDFWEYDPSADSWTKKADFGGSARYSAVAFSIGSKGYIGTGQEGAYTTDFWEYDANCTPLPVELLSFSAKWLNENRKEALIEWQTVNEVDHDYFEVERSIDALQFTSIMQIDGKGTGNQTTDYLEIDSEPHLDGVSYYRLKQVDINGNATYSNIDALNLPEGLEISNLYPNPTIGDLQLVLHSSLSAALNIRILNSLGQEILMREISVERGVHHIDFDLSELSGGNYFVEASTKDGKYTVSQKFIKEEI